MSISSLELPEFDLSIDRDAVAGEHFSKALTVQDSGTRLESQNFMGFSRVSTLRNQYASLSSQINRDKQPLPMTHPLQERYNSLSGKRLAQQNSLPDSGWHSNKGFKELNAEYNAFKGSYIQGGQSLTKINDLEGIGDEIPDLKIETGKKLLTLQSKEILAPEINELNQIKETALNGNLTQEQIKKIEQIEMSFNLTKNNVETYNGFTHLIKKDTDSGKNAIAGLDEVIDIFNNNGNIGELMEKIQHIRSIYYGHQFGGDSEPPSYE